VVGLVALASVRSSSYGKNTITQGRFSGNGKITMAYDGGGTFPGETRALYDDML